MRATYRVGLLGHGIGPSLSPALHMREAKLLGLDYQYRIVDLIERHDVDLDVELRRLESDGFAATNITHPFKQAVLQHVDEQSDNVRRIGSANLVLLAGGRRIAHNTDCTGFRAPLQEFLGERSGRGAVLQIGAGGAGRATVSSLVDMGFPHIVVHDMVESSTTAVVERFAEPSSGRVISSGGSLATWLPTVAGVVHATPVGMEQHPGVALDVDLLDPSAWVAEVVYRPLDTELVRRARSRGLATLDGGAMAVGQAADSLRLITGHDPDVDRMHAHFDALIGVGDTDDAADPY